MFFIYPASDTGKQTAEEKKEAVQKEELKAEGQRTGCGGMVADSMHPPPGQEESPYSGCPSSAAQAQQEASAPQLFSPAAALNKAPSILERPPALTETMEKPPLTPKSQKKSPSTAPAFPQPLENLLVSPPPQEKTPSTIPAASESLETPQVQSLSHKEGSPGTLTATVDLRNSTQERGETGSQQHTMRSEPADQRTEPPLT